MEVKSFTNSYLSSKGVTKLGIGYYKQSFVAIWQKFVSISANSEEAVKHEAMLVVTDNG